MVLSADFGTSSLKLSVLDEDLRTLQSVKQVYHYTMRAGEMVEEDPLELMQALVDGCNALDKTLRGQIDLICYDAYAPSLVLMDGDGAALYPVVTHLDRRSRAQSKEICQAFGKDEYQAITGTYPFTGGVSLTSVMWFLKEHPSLCARVRRMGHLPTYLHKQLTGQWVIDLANASMTGLYDTVGQTGWSGDLLRAFAVPQGWMCPIADPGEALGTLLPRMAQDMGLKEGIPVAVGTHDVVAAHAGVGNNRSGQILNTAGSSDMLSILTDTPALHPGYYVRCAGQKDIWQIYATTSGGFALEWFRKQFCRELDINAFYKEYISRCVPLCGAGPLQFDPYLAEDRQYLERRLAAWRNLSLDTKRDEMLASLIYAMQNVLCGVLREAGRYIALDRVMKVSGGMADTAILDLKKRMFEGFRLEKVDNSPILGNARLALAHTCK